MCEKAHAPSDIQMEENPMDGQKFSRRLLLVATIVAIVLFAILCFVAGFAVAYFAVPDDGQFSDMHIHVLH